MLFAQIASKCPFNTIVHWSPLVWSDTFGLVGGKEMVFHSLIKSVRVTCGGLAFKTVHADNKLEKNIEKLKITERY